MCVVVVARMSSGIPFPHKLIGIPLLIKNFYLLQLCVHKNMVCIVTHKMSVITLLQWCHNFLKNMKVICRKWVVMCTIRANESRFGNLFIVWYSTASTNSIQTFKITCMDRLYTLSYNCSVCISRSACKKFAVKWSASSLWRQFFISLHIFLCVIYAVKCTVCYGVFKNLEFRFPIYHSVYKILHVHACCDWQ
jgi:hypothetical protein